MNQHEFCEFNYTGFVDLSLDNTDKFTTKCENHYEEIEGIEGFSLKKRKVAHESRRHTPYSEGTESLCHY